MTPAKRFIVRTALVTSTTLATLMGAQALASLDAATFASPISAPAETQVVQSVQIPLTIRAAAPNIVILRHAGDQALTGNTQSMQLMPPNPVAVAPILVQPAIPSTRSSR